jgi:sugar/nucleoside kinase (ribokinase family)
MGFWRGTGKGFYYSAAYQVPGVDTTGAGDIFRAGFIYGVWQGWDLDRQLDFLVRLQP